MTEFIGTQRAVEEITEILERAAEASLTEPDRAQALAGIAQAKATVALVHAVNSLNDTVMRGNRG